LVTSHVGRLLKQITEGKRRKKEDISSYWMTLRKREDTGIWRRKH